VDNGSEFKNSSFILYLSKTGIDKEELVYGCSNHGGVNVIRGRVHKVNP